MANEALSHPSGEHVPHDGDRHKDGERKDRKGKEPLDGETEEEESKNGMVDAGEGEGERREKGKLPKNSEEAVEEAADAGLK